MEGSNLFVMGDNVAIKAKLKPSLNNAHKYQWDYSNIYLKLNNLQQYASDVTAYVTALRPVKNFNLPISIVDRKSGNILQTVYFPITVKPKYFIETNTSDICNNQNISLSIKNIEFTPGATIKWYALSNLSLISGQGSPNAIFKSSGSGKGMARATITYDGESYDANFDDVWIGVPAKPILSVNSAAPGIVQYSAEISCNARKYDKITWSISGGTLNSKTGTTVSAVPSGKGMMSVVATVTNSCGSTSGSTSLTVYNPSSNGGLSMAERSTSETKTYEIYSLNGNLIHKYFSINFNPKEINIPNGIYIIYSTDINGKEINSQKVIINN